MDQKNRRKARFSAWYVQASYFVTGEHRTYDQDAGVFVGVKPNKNYRDAGRGALELTLRFSGLDFDDAGAGVSGGEVDSATGGVNWYLNPNARVMLNVVHANLDGGGDITSYVMRFGVHF